VPTEFSLDRLAVGGLSLKQQKDIRGVCPALSSPGRTPARQDLSLMWTAAERALRSLGPTIEPARFT
jgi:hypothetical protein